MWWLTKSEVLLVFYFSLCSFSFSSFIRYMICLGTSTFWQHSPNCFICRQTDCREEHFLTNPNLLTFVFLYVIHSDRSSFLFSGGLFSCSNRRWFFFWSYRYSLVFSTASNNFFKMVSAISVADKSFLFKSRDSPTLLSEAKLFECKIMSTFE